MVAEPKTAKARRVTKLPGFAYEVLKAYCSRLNDNQRLIFTTRAENPIGPRSFTCIFKIDLKAAGLPEIRFHDLRHTTVSLQISLGISPPVIQSIVGHTSPLLTLSVYAHTSLKMQDEGAEKVDALMRSEGEHRKIPGQSGRNREKTRVILHA